MHLCIFTERLDVPYYSSYSTLVSRRLLRLAVRQSTAIVNDPTKAPVLSILASERT